MIPFTQHYLSSAVIGQTNHWGTWNNVTDQTEYHGKVFVYTRAIDGSWSDEPQVLEASDKADGDHFGDAVDISGNRILVGASERGVYGYWENSDALLQRGKAYVFVNTNGAWVQEGDPLYSDYDATDPRFHFGAFVALDGDTALIGHDSELGGVDVRWDEETADNIYTHSNLIVYGFSRSSDGTWKQSVKLTPSSLGEDLELRTAYNFGKGVELMGDHALIEGDRYAEVFLFENWQYTRTERPRGSRYAWTVRPGHLALGSDTIYVGSSYGGNDSDQGRVVVMDKYTKLVSNH